MHSVFYEMMVTANGRVFGFLQYPYLPPPCKAAVPFLLPPFFAFKIFMGLCYLKIRIQFSHFTDEETDKRLFNLF